MFNVLGSVTLMMNRGIDFEILESVMTMNIYKYLDE